VRVRRILHGGRLELPSLAANSQQLVALDHVKNDTVCTLVGIEDSEILRDYKWKEMNNNNNKFG
jgi:hypothetical protein